MYFVRGVAGLLRKGSGNQAGELYPAVETQGETPPAAAPPWSEVQFSQDEKEELLHALWQQYQDSTEQVESQRALEAFLVAFIRIYEDWLPVDCAQPQGGDATAWEELAKGTEPSNSEGITVGCSFGHPTRVIVGLVQELKVVTTSIVNLYSSTDVEVAVLNPSDIEAALRLLSTINILTRSWHNRRIFISFGGLQALMAHMKAAVVHLKTIASLFTTENGPPPPALTQFSFLKCLLAYVVSIVYNYMDAEVRVIHRVGTPTDPQLIHVVQLRETSRPSIGGSPLRLDSSVSGGASGSSWSRSASSQGRQAVTEPDMQGGLAGSVPFLETGGLNWFVELLRTLRKLRLRRCTSETSLEKLVLQTLKAAILSNPRAQNHFRSIGGLEVLLEGLGNPSKQTSEASLADTGRLISGHAGVLEDFQLQILSLEVLREAIFRNIHSLQSLRDAGGVHKFIEIIRWAAFTFPEMSPGTLASPGTVHLRGTLPLSPTQMSGLATRSPDSESAHGGRSQELSAEDRRFNFSPNRQDFLVEDDDLQGWNGRVAHLCRILCSFLVPAGDIPSFASGLIGGQDAVGVSGVYWDLATRWIVNVLLGVFSGGEQEREALETSRLLSSTLQHYVLYVFKKMLEISPSVLQLFREHGVWNVMFTEYFFYFGLEAGMLQKDVEKLSLEGLDWLSASSSWQLFASSEKAREGFDAVDTEPLRLEVISFVELAATVSGSPYNLPECSALMKSVKQCALIPSIATMLLKSLHRILQLAVEPTLTAFQQLDAVGVLSRIMEIQRLAFAKLSEQGSEISGRPLPVHGSESGPSTFDWQQTAGREVWWDAREVMFALFGEYLSAAEEAQVEAAHNLKVLDVLFNLLWEQKTKEFALQHIMMLMKLPPSFEQHQEAKIELCLKYLEALPRAQVESREAGIQTLRDLLSGVRGILHTDIDYYQGLFRESECFVHIVSLLNEDHSLEAGRQLCLDVLLTLTHLLLGNESSKVAFRELVGPGYKTLQSLLLERHQGRPDQTLLSAILDMLVEGTFEMPTNMLIKNEDALLLFFNTLRKCDEGLQSSFLGTVRRILEESTANQASCVRAGLLSLLLDWFGEEQNDDLMTKVAQLMQIIGGHSISGKDIRRIFALLRSTKDGCRPRHGSLLLKILQGMLIGEGPTAFFELSGQNSGISIQTPVRWPTSKGFSFSCWARVEAFPSTDNQKVERGMMGLFSFLTETGKGCTAVIGEDQFLIETVTHKRQAVLSKITFRAKRWYFLVITHSTGRALGGGTSLKIYVDGVLIGSERLRYAKLNEALTVCTVGGRCPLPCVDGKDLDVASGQEAPPFYGQLGPVYLFDEALSSQQILGIHSLGPSYMYSFLPNEVGCVPENVATHSVIDARDGLGSRMVFGYNAQASKGQVLYDISPVLEQSADKTLHIARILPGTLLCYRRRVQDIIHCVGGIGVFFPLLTQLDQPLRVSSTIDSAQEPSQAQLLPESPVSTGMTDAECASETNVAVDVINLLQAVLTGNFANQQYIHNVRGLSVLGFLLQSVSPGLLTVMVVSALHSLLTTLTNIPGSQLAGSLVKELLSKVYLNPHIWIFTPFLVQREVYVSLLNYVEKDPGHLRGVWSLPATLDVLRQFYWEKAKGRKAFGTKPLLHPVSKEIIGERPSQQEVAKLRFHVLSLAQAVLRETVTLADAKALVAFLETADDVVCVEDVLLMLLTMSTHKPFLIAFVEHICTLGGCQILLNLLKRQEESVRMLGLRIIGVLVLATPAEKKGGRLFIGRSAYDQHRAEKLRLAPLFTAIAERLFMFPFTDTVRATLFDVLLGDSCPKQVSRKGSVPQLETKLESDVAVQSAKFGQAQSWVTLLRSSERPSGVVSSSSHFALPQILGIVLRFMLICQDFMMRAAILKDVLHLLEVNTMNNDVLTGEAQWQDWLLSLMVDDVTRLKEASTRHEVVEMIVEEVKLIRRIFCVVHTYCICSVRGGWRYIERTVNFVNVYAEKGLPDNVSLLQDIFADLIEAVLQAYPSQALLLAQPCRDNVLYLLVLVDELVMKDAFQLLPFLNELSLEDGTESSSLSGGYIDLGPGLPRTPSTRSTLTELAAVPSVERKVSLRGWQRHESQSVEAESSEGKCWRLYDNVWILLGAMNGRGTSGGNNPSAVGTGPSFGQRARGLVESLNIPAAEMAAAVVAGGLGAVVGINVPSKLVDKAAKLRSERCPRVVFRLVLLYLYEANFENATRCVHEFLALLPVFLSAESEISKNRLQLFLWSLLDARGQIGGMDDGARFQMISQLIQETIEHGKSILVNSTGDKRDDDSSSNSASVHSLLQQDRVIAAVKEEAKHLKVTATQRGQEMELLHTELDEILVLEAEQGRALEEQVLTTSITVCTTDRARRVTAQLAYDEAQQSISDYWCHMFRDLTEERGAWSVVPFPNNLRIRWKLDKTEDLLRRRLRLKRNYYFNEEFQHVQGSAPSAKNSEVNSFLDKGNNAELLGGSVKAFLLKGLRGVSEEESLESPEDELKEVSNVLEEIQAQLQVPAIEHSTEIEGQDALLQQSQQTAASTDTEDEVLLSVSCVLITSKRKLAGRLDILQSSIHFYGEFIVEGNGGSSTFTLSGGLKKADGNTSEAGEKSSRRATKLPRNSDSWVGDLDKENSMERIEPVQHGAEHGPTSVKRHRRWDISQVKAVHGTRFLLKFSALEIFFSGSNPPVFFNFPSQKYAKDVATKILGLRNEVYSSRSSSKDKEDLIMFIDKRKAVELAERSKEQWRRRDISNFEYLMSLNTLAGRSYNDLTQYPVFPWVLADYTSEKLDLSSPATFRNFSKPVGALDEKRFEVFEERYQNFSDPDIPSFYYGSHYSSMGIVLFYLIRLEPFTTLNRQLQGGKFDHADRLFHSIEGAYSNCMKNTSDVKELIPEFFYLPEFLKNSNDFFLGVKQDGQKLGDIVLPPWAKGSAEEFIQRSREGLESEYVSEHLHEWIDLIFGYKQRGKAAVEAANVFYHLTYEGAVDLEVMDDPLSRAAVEDQIANFGQTPIQLFRRRHPKRGPPIPVARPLYYVPASITLTSSVQCLGPQGRQDGSPLVFIGVMDNKVVTISGDLMVSVRLWITPALQGGGSFTFSSSQEPFYGIGPDATLSRKIPASYADGLVVSSESFGLLQVRSGSYLFTGGHWDNSFKGISLLDGRLIQSSCYHKDVVTCISVAIDGSVVVTGSRDTTVMVWDIDSSSNVTMKKGHGDRSSKPESILLDKPRHVLCGHDDVVTSLAVRVELDLVVSGSTDKTCILHTLRKGTYLRSIMHPTGSQVSKVAVSQHGLIALYSSDDLNLRVCSINGKWLAASDSHGRLNSMDISSCGEFLVCGGDQGQVILRQLHSLEILRRYDAIGTPISSLVVTPEDCFLVGTQDGTIHVYSIEPQQQRKGGSFFTGLRGR